MSRQGHPGRSWVRPLIAGLALALVATPFAMFPGPASSGATTLAADVTPASSADPAASPDPSTSPDPGPSLAPSPEPSPAPEPSLAPSSEPEPSLAPSSEPEPSIEPVVPPAPVPSEPPADAPSAEPSVEPSSPTGATPAPSAPPDILYELSPGQQRGRRVGPAIPIYKLELASLAPTPTSPHGGTGLDGSDCAACHAAHTSQQADLLAPPSPQSTVCYACHAAGLGATDVESVFAALPANVTATDRYFSHPITGTTAAAGITCSDCHNPHLSSAARPAQSTTGWTASGPIAAAAGVAVDNGPAGTAPTYLPSAGGTRTYEYEVCLSCHSGAATLPARDPAHPSWWALDAGIEFNPANRSEHPVEAAGRNRTAQMTASLAGQSPFKAWTFDVDATIRCTHCHGDPSTVNQTASGTPLTPAASALEASHGSPNRGLLTAPYRDRDLKAEAEPYAAADFALCYLCHAERPFVDPNVDPGAPDTAFPLHGLHLTGIGGQAGASLSIDTPGAGQGLAICSECHFRTHSTALAYQPGDTAPVARATGAAGLVNFAPNVVGLASQVPLWTAPDGSGSGSCALTCHGYTHDPAAAPTGTYAVAPATGFTANPTRGSAGSDGLTVQFSDATRYVDASATWSWTFGDGATSTNRNPSHVYPAAGTYTVSLTVQRTDGDGLATTMTRTGFITVTP